MSTVGLLDECELSVLADPSLSEPREASEVPLFSALFVTLA